MSAWQRCARPRPPSLRNELGAAPRAGKTGRRSPSADPCAADQPGQAQVLRVLRAAAAHARTRTSPLRPATRQRRRAPGSSPTPEPQERTRRIATPASGPRPGAPRDLRAQEQSITSLIRLTSSRNSRRALKRGGASRQAICPGVHPLRVTAAVRCHGDCGVWHASRKRHARRATSTRPLNSTPSGRVVRAPVVRRDVVHTGRSRPRARRSAAASIPRPVRSEDALQLLQQRSSARRSIRVGSAGPRNRSTPGPSPPCITFVAERHHQRRVLRGRPSSSRDAWRERGVHAEVVATASRPMTCRWSPPGVGSRGETRPLQAARMGIARGCKPPARRRRARARPNGGDEACLTSRSAEVSSSRPHRHERRVAASSLCRLHAHRPRATRRSAGFLPLVPSTQPARG